VNAFPHGSDTAVTVPSGQMTDDTGYIFFPDAGKYAHYWRVALRPFWHPKAVPLTVPAAASGTPSARDFR